MDNTLIQLVLAFLTAAVALNLWLTFRLIYTIKYLRLDNNTAQQMPVGATTPDFTATRLTDNTVIASNNGPDTAKVWIFLSTACTKCKAKIPELEQVLLATQDAGVQLRMLTNESKRSMTGFLAGSALQENALIVDKTTHSLFNPQGASPFYQFVDDQNILQAQGLIGDDNWQGFVSQLTQMKQAAA
jgi:hypothetical protein